jgi:Fe-S-cluster containining protein
MEKHPPRRLMKERLIPFENQKFKCLQCSECCKARSVPLTLEDIKRMSVYKDPQEFIIVYNERKLAIERRVWDAGCVFSDGWRCTIHEIKPLVCRMYPVCISNTPLLGEEEPITLQDNVDMYVYVDAACEGVGQGEPLDIEEIKKKGLQLRNEMMVTNLEAVIGWYTHEYEDDKGKE